MADGLLVNRGSDSGHRIVLPPMVSADSHVIEDASLWSGLIAPGYFSAGEIFNARSGNKDALARIDEMQIDGVVAEVLYPSLGLILFGIDDATAQERCFARYNDWLTEFCQQAPDHLVGVGLISAYRMDEAVRELERCHAAGLRGAMIWQTPHPDYPFTSRHYEPFWAAAAELEMPVSLHITTGFNHNRVVLTPLGQPAKKPTFANETAEAELDARRGRINLKLLDAMNALMDILCTGTFDRFPGLKIVFVENEIGWLPFILDQHDEQFRRHPAPLSLSRKPSEYFGSQLFATFFRDPIGPKMLPWWGSTGCMWSNDYPHHNSTWPHSVEVVSETLGYLPPDVLERVVSGTARDLYKLPQ